MIAMSLALTAFLVPAIQAAEEVASRAVYHTQKAETMEAGDVPGHVVGVSDQPGLIIVTKGPNAGEVGSRKATVYFDAVKGKGTGTTYAVYTFRDGSTKSYKATGTFAPGEGGKGLTFEGTYEVIGGTGRFEGLKGKGTFKGERIGPREGFSYVDATGTEWK